MEWRAERKWAAETVVIVAGGPSLTLAQTRLIAMARERNLVRVIAINDAIYPCWWADIGYACDEKWWKYHGSLPAFAGERVSLEPTPFKSVLVAPRYAGGGIDPKGRALATGAPGGNSGYQALQIAVHCGAARIILVGYDMRGKHWFGDHPIRVGGVDPPFSDFIAAFVAIVPELERHKVKVLNASPKSELKCFPAVDLALELTAMGKWQ
jgi:hypothetical protein